MQSRQVLRRRVPEGTLDDGWAQGRAAQVVPIKPTLKAPRPTLLKLRRDGSLSNFAFNLNLRHYNQAACATFAENHLMW